MGNGILVFCETDGGSLRKSAFELLSKAAALGLGPVSALVVARTRINMLWLIGAGALLGALGVVG